MSVRISKFPALSSPRSMKIIRLIAGSIGVSPTGGRHTGMAVESDPAESTDFKLRGCGHISDLLHPGNDV